MVQGRTLMLNKNALNSEPSIGNTPLVRIKNPSGGKAKLFAKLESHNPFGSIKDRAAFWMLKQAEKNGEIRKNETIIIEPTAGNTGIALAGIAKELGYKVQVTVPEKVTTETKQLLRSYGAEVLETPDDLCPRVGAGIDQAVALATSIVKGGKGKYFMPNQYENGANPLAHYSTTGPEIWQQTKGKVTHFFAGIGTGGTIIGTAQYLKQKNESIKIIAISAKDEKHHLQGLRNLNVSSKPKVLENGLNEAKAKGVILVDKWIEVSDADAFATVKRIYENDGLLVGPSSGAVMAGAVELLGDENEGLGVMIFADDGNKYKSLYREINLF